jgi:hypothetical protein
MSVKKSVGVCPLANALSANGETHSSTVNLISLIALHEGIISVASGRKNSTGETSGMSEPSD